MYIAVVAGELSGDILGADLIRRLHAYYPAARFVGIGGEKMMAAGLHSWYPLERLSVMGLVEVVQHFPELLVLRHRLFKRLVAIKPAVFIGIDAPDFNIGLERKLRRQHIPTVHYVSPSVWAWRRWRVRKIRRSVDLMLTLFPFEAEFYRAENITALFVGHPLADALPLSSQVLCQSARAELQLSYEHPCLAILPGSRRGEISQLAPVFFQTARCLQQQLPALQIIVAAATDTLQETLEQLVTEHGLKARVIARQSQRVMAAADTILLASGTATLEAALIKKPMLVAYKVNPLTAWIANRLVKLPHFALPNLLANERIVPEFFQKEVSPERLGPLLLQQFEQTAQPQLLSKYTEIHRQLKRDAGEKASLAIARLIEEQL